MYIRTDTSKRESWYPLRPILTITLEGGYVEVLGRAGKRVKSAFRDTRIVPPVDSFSEVVQTATDTLHDSLAELLDLSSDVHDDCEQANEVNNDNEERCDVYDFSESNDSPNMASIGNRVQVYEPIENIYYYGAVSRIDDHEIMSLHIMTMKWKHSNSVMTHGDTSRTYSQMYQGL